MTYPRTAQYRAHRAVTSAVLAGKLPRIGTQICVDCGRKAQHYDHRDYLKPLDVVPVCRQCNVDRGRGKNRDIIVKSKKPDYIQSLIRAKARRASALKMHKKGMSLEQIGNKLDVSKQRASEMIKRAKYDA